VSGKSGLGWRGLGLGVLPPGGIRALGVAAAIGLAFGIWMAAADAFLFRAAVPAGQTAFVATTSALDRIAYFAPRAVLDEILFRLLLLSALIRVLAGGARPPPAARCWIAIVAGSAIYLLFHPAWLATPEPLVLAREAALHLSAGILWGYLYWRQGLLAAITAHVGAHLSLQPLLGLFFA
jgi:hypothetical protein